jgi:hypothetical protein
MRNPHSVRLAGSRCHQLHPPLVPETAPHGTTIKQRSKLRAHKAGIEWSGEASFENN